LDFKLTLPVDVLFIDTNHEYEHTLKELMMVIPFISKKGIIIMHDTNLDTIAYTDQKSMVSNAINKVFELDKKTDWKHDFIIETKKAKIINHACNNGMAYIFFR